MGSGSYKTGLIYKHLRGDFPQVTWSKLFVGNLARPRSQLVLWLACHGRMATKDRLYKFGLITSDTCCFCSQGETLDHLLFECNITESIWCQVLAWLKVQHTPDSWREELCWILNHSRGKGWRQRLLKLAFTETVYETRLYRNDNCFGRTGSNGVIAQRIIDMIVYRAWLIPKLKAPVGRLMLG